MTEPNFLNELGLENVEANPNFIPSGKYPAFVFDSQVKMSKRNIKQWVITFKIAPESETTPGRTQSEFKNLQFTGDAESISFQKSFLKQRVLSLGIPESRINVFQPNEVIGQPVWITITHKHDKDGVDRQNVGDVSLRDVESNTPASSGVSQSQSAVPASAPVL